MTEATKWVYVFRVQYSPVGPPMPGNQRVFGNQLVVTAENDSAEAEQTFMQWYGESGVLVEEIESLGFAVGKVSV